MNARLPDTERSLSMLTQSTTPLRLCSVEGCSRIYHARGFCTLHYQRHKRRGMVGDPSIPCGPHSPINHPVGRPGRPVLEQFWEKVRKTPSCWIWLGPLMTAGYGVFYDGGPIAAHRWSYKHFVGPIPDGLEIDHLCERHECVNPSHLEPVTHLVNCQRAVERRRQRADVI